MRWVENWTGRDEKDSDKTDKYVGMFISIRGVGGATLHRPSLFHVSVAREPPTRSGR